MLNELRVSQLVLISDTTLNSSLLIHKYTFIVIEFWELVFTVFLNELADDTFSNIKVLCMLFIPEFQTRII